jgi:hypothetical protein
LFCLSAFTGTVSEVVDVLCEWGNLYIVTTDYKVSYCKVHVHADTQYDIAGDVAEVELDPTSALSPATLHVTISKVDTLSYFAIAGN